MTETTKNVSFEQEHLRLVSGYNDIFVGIACIITFVSLTTLITGKYLDQILVLGSAFGLAWYFVRHQRMRFTGIVISTAVAISGLTLGFQFFYAGSIPDVPPPPSDLGGNVTTLPIMLPVVVPLTISAILSFGFWRFARIPLAHALGVLAILLAILVTVIATQLMSQLIDEHYFDELDPLPFVDLWAQMQTLRAFPALATSFILGCLVEAYAIWWDVKDPKRQSVATDVAFWTHIVAAPFIVQPLYWWAEDLAWSATSEVILGVLLFVLLLVFALVINRRALLIGAMVWVLAALFTVADMAVAGLSMGVILLIIAAAWNKTRQLIEPIMPELLQHRFPTLVAET
ncbi:MAG: hypothetical protein OXG15_05030 [Gammaproteobacteria bacterium]|nr:hypothetical protein [Gammaproteobacteria bacterium]